MSSCFAMFSPRASAEVKGVEEFDHVFRALELTGAYQPPILKAKCRRESQHQNEPAFPSSPLTPAAARLPRIEARSAPGDLRHPSRSESFASDPCPTTPIIDRKFSELATHLTVRTRDLGQNLPEPPAAPPAPRRRAPFLASLLSKTRSLNRVAPGPAPIPVSDAPGVPAVYARDRRGSFVPRPPRTHDTGAVAAAAAAALSPSSPRGAASPHLTPVHECSAASRPADLSAAAVSPLAHQSMFRAHSNLALTADKLARALDFVASRRPETEACRSNAQCFSAASNALTPSLVSIAYVGN